MNKVYYSQEDTNWRHVMFSDHNDPTQTIGTSACGPTSFAMAVSSLLGKPILPTETAKYAVDHGFRTVNTGTMWTYFADAAKNYGLTCKQTSNLDEVKQALSSGALVVASMRSGHFTSGGHYVLLVGAGGDWIDVYDPNHDNRKYGVDGLIDQGIKDDGKVRAKESVIRREAGQYWILKVGGIIGKPGVSGAGVAFPFPTKEEYPMTAEDANKIIPYLQSAWKVAHDNGDEAGKKEAARLADELRKASGQKPQNSPS